MALDLLAIRDWEIVDNIQDTNHVDGVVVYNSDEDRIDIPDLVLNVHISAHKQRIIVIRNQAIIFNIVHVIDVDEINIIHITTAD